MQLIQEFNMPHYQHHIFICQNERAPGHEFGCCLSQGSQAILKYMRRRYRELGIPRTCVSKAGCLGQCNMGPAVVIYPDNIWYTLKTVEDAERVIQEHIIQGVPVQSLVME